MKKILIYSCIFTCILIFAPAFMVQYDDEPQQVINTKNIDKINNGIKQTDKEKQLNTDNKNKDDITVFFSNTCYKKTYYINADKVNVYDNDSEKSKVKFILYKDDVVVAFKESNGYIYCEENKEGRKGWIKKNNINLKGSINKKTEYTLDVNLKSQSIDVLKNDKTIKKVSCSTGILGNQDTETPLGIFSIQSKGEYFYSTKYEQGARYYIKFFSNYLIHSIPVDKKGNIIEDEKSKIGFPASHGCIRISIQDAEWIYKNIPEGSSVIIHY